MPKVLIVEDDQVLANNIVHWLQSEQYVVDTVADGEAAMEYVRTYEYEVIVLDWMLPNISGLEVCKKIRAEGTTVPILMLTGKSGIEDKETGLDAGADDYLTKPFHMRELTARLRALGRRQPTITADTLTFDDLVLDMSNRRVLRNGREIHLLPREYALFEFLMKHPNQVFSANAILDRVWPSSADMSPDSVRTYVARLRSKVDKEGSPTKIQNVHGVGYKLGPAED